MLGVLVACARVVTESARVRAACCDMRQRILARCSLGSLMCVCLAPITTTKFVHFRACWVVRAQIVVRMILAAKRARKRRARRERKEQRLSASQARS